MGGKFRGLGLRCCSADRRMGVGPVGWPSRRSVRPVAGACGAHPRNPTSEERSSKDTRETAGIVSSVDACLALPDAGCVCRQGAAGVPLY
eukprot:scaffold57685_cov96-Phaeocystis_antarctica.AAC.1